jgi:hypothetical protein
MKILNTLITVVVMKQTTIIEGSIGAHYPASHQYFTWAVKQKETMGRVAESLFSIQLWCWNISVCGAEP